MRNIYLSAVLVLAVLLICWRSIVPVEKKLKLGKDLRGGVSLVYAVQIRPDENAKMVLDQTISVLKQRINPVGTLDITFVAQGRDRIEVTMPLPGERVKALRQAYEDELANLGVNSLSPARFDQLMRAPAEQRAAQIEVISKADAAQGDRLKAAVAAFDAEAAARNALATATTATGAERDALVNAAGAAGEVVDQKRAEYFKSIVTAEDVRRVLTLSDKDRILDDPSATDPLLARVTIPSPRKQGFERLLAAHPDAKAQIDRVISVHNTFISERTTLDDPQDLVKLLKGAGVLTFRITVDPQSSATANTHPEEASLREQLRARGPKNVKSNDARWYKLNKLESWYDDVRDLRMIETAAAVYFAGRGYVVEPFDGEYYMLAWDTRKLRLTPAEGDWSVASSKQTLDELNKPAIAFEMNPRGGALLGDLTLEPSKIKSKMAVMLDDEIYTAPTLQSAISRSGRITGSFEQSEVDYIVRVLNAGSLQAKLSPEPLSTQQVGPQLGQDNLDKGLKAGVVALVVVGGFMIVYYFGCGVISVIALLCNALIIVGAMALAQASFTMPGIAGLILTFGTAVDANVLIYERIREEIRNGQDVRTAVRLGFHKALSSIVDGNVANLIVCIVLAYIGTPEIRGFAITMGIGVIGTLFCALVITRLFFDVLVHKFGWRRVSMLPMAVPALQSLLTPKINWLKLRYIFFIVSTIYVAMGLYAAGTRGDKMLHIEFLGGTQVEVQFKRGPDGNPLKLTRAEVEERVKAEAAKLDDRKTSLQMQSVDVTPINPDNGGVRSNWFLIKTVATNQTAVEQVVSKALSDQIEQQQALRFNSSSEKDWTKVAVYPINHPTLGECIERPQFKDSVLKFDGGVAVVLDGIEPPIDAATLKARLDKARSKPEYADTLARTRELIVLEESAGLVKSAAVVVRDEDSTIYTDEDRWGERVAKREWALTCDALTRAGTSASIQNFSPAIAETFKAQAVAAIGLSFLLIGIYIWVRFKGFRYSFAAIIALVHDILTVIGAVALCEIIFEYGWGEEVARSLLLMPFKVDLNMVAAMLTVAGYSLNDTIIIMDRIRETKGKLVHASAEIINSAINQTISRTVITSGMTLLSGIILYIFGGEGVRPFAFALTVGIGVGTYSSIAVAAPIVWSRKGSKQTEASLDTGIVPTPTN